MLNHTAGAARIEQAHPRVIKILDTWGSMLDAARTYKAATPGGIVVLRVYTPKRYNSTDSPSACATDFWATVLQPAVQNLSAADRALIDFVEGPNECDTTPCWGSLQNVKWFNDFWVALAPIIAQGGFRPCAFSIPVGNPPGPQAEIRQQLDAIVPALRVCKQYNGAWSYHAYTPDWTKDTTRQYYYSLRYRQFYAYFAQSYPELADLPLILTEAGFDNGGSATGSGWQANGTAAQYEDWLAWWDDQVRLDSYVLGSTLFQIGGGSTSWPSFDLEPVSAWMADYLVSKSLPVLACSTKTLAATVYRGSNPPNAGFTITNTGYRSMSYSIADNASWLTVVPIEGSSTGEADPVTVSCFTAGLPAGTHAARITITAPGANNSPQVIDVTVTVQERPVPGDLDGDRRVDEADVLLFRACMTGPDRGPVSGDCVKADLDGDRDVDQADFGWMQRCITGDLDTGDPDCL
jgi:hypothetical protein